MYECPICGATSSDAGAMERHLATHDQPSGEPEVASPPPPVSPVTAADAELAAEGLAAPSTWSTP